MGGDEESKEEVNLNRLLENGAGDLNKLLHQVVQIGEYLEEQEGKQNVIERRQTVDQHQIAGVRFNVIQYNSSYVGDMELATNIYHAQKLGMKLRSLEVELNNGSVVMESGMFQSSEGEVVLHQKVTPMHLIGGIVRKMNKETFFRPEFGGTGIVRLESNFKFIHLIKVDRPTRLVLEKGIYLASAGDWKYTTAKNFNVGMMIFSDKNILQTELRGTGLVALELPLHPSELIKHTVTKTRPFKVSGEYVLYWSGNLSRKINPAKRLLGNMASGRGIVEEYTGEGYVYTAPTLGFYNDIATNLAGKTTSNVNTIGEGVDHGKKRRSFLEVIGLRGSNQDKYEE